jgi:hypothetical protein
MMDRLAETPAKANNFLTAMQALSAYGRPSQSLLQGITAGVKRFASDGGHKPWTPEQLRAARDKLTGVVRRGIMLYLYTGPRGSDIVRIGFADIGFSVRQRNTGREVWCPTVPELAAEIATWEKRPGPFLLQPSGKPYTRKLFWEHFDRARVDITELARRDATWAALQCRHSTARAGLSVGQIGDITGMSPGHYRALLPLCRSQGRWAGRVVQPTAGRKDKGQTVKHRR